MRGKRIVLVASCLALLFIGCDKEEVIYDMDNSSKENHLNEVDTTEVQKIDGNLAKQLGVTDTVWKETISTGEEDIYVNATITIPEVSDMYTLEVSEHYYTPEEKKKLVEYFMGTDSVKVNVDKVPTKEWARKRIELCDNVVRSEYPADQGSYAQSYLNEKKRLESIMSNLPAKEDVSDMITDYSENHYICNKDGVEYTLSFDVNKEENRSSWTMSAVDENDFSDRGLYPVYDTSGLDNNLSKMTKEEACEKAEVICKDIGLEDMKAISAYDLLIQSMVVTSDSMENSRCDGYYIVLTRGIEGIAVNCTRYYGEDMYLDTEGMKNGYAPEKVIIAINDNGLLEMTYEGCFTREAMGSPVKLLEYEQIQNIIRSELEHSEAQSNTWRGLSLEYIRVWNEAKSDQYTYIPAWCFSVDAPYEQWDSNPASYTIWVNAIDGSRIDLKEEGVIYYQTIDDELDLMMLLE